MLSVSLASGRPAAKADYFVVCSGRRSTHSRNILEKLLKVADVVFFPSEMVYNIRESVCITEYCTYSNEMKQNETFRLCASFL
jgi:hypothetical protein